MNSCETTNLDLQDNPNELTLDSADPNFILNGIQFQFIGQHFTLHATTDGLMRYINQFGTNARNGGAGTMDDPWSATYSITNNLNLLKDISAISNLPNHVGMGQVLEAFAYVNLVDYIGTAVYSEAVNQEFPQPNLDSGESIYAAMYLQLNEAISNLSQTGSITPEDLIYDGDMSKWIKLANTLKIKMYVQTKLVGTPGAASDINAIVASGKYISNIDDDFQAFFNSNETNPDTRHPYFAGNYTTGAQQMMSNDFMNTLRYGKFIEDPRLKYYFYRQSLNDPSNAGGNNLLPCALDPAAYDYCYIGDGYWGRDHADDEGIPNHGFFMTSFGIYPAGGAFDEAPSQADLIASATLDFPNQMEYTDLDEYLFFRLGSVNADLVNSSNIGGAGIHPMILSSFTKFMLAEAALSAPAGLGTAGNSRTLLMEGMTMSFAKVAAFSGIAMDAANVTTYIDEVMAQYDGTINDDRKLKIIIREYYIAAYGNSIEAYNNYRRTGYPVLEEAVISNTSFPRTYFLPSSELNSNDNPNLEQKLVTDQVFWDTNPAGFIN